MLNLILLLSFKALAQCGPIPPGMIQGTDCSLRVMDDPGKKAFIVAEGEIKKIVCANAFFEKKLFHGEMLVTKVLKGVDHSKIDFEFTMSQKPKPRELSVVAGQKGVFTFEKGSSGWLLRGAKPANSVSTTLPECLK